MNEESMDLTHISQQALIEDFTLKLNYLKANGSIPLDVLNDINIIYKTDLISDLSKINK